MPKGSPQRSTGRPNVQRSADVINLAGVAGEPIGKGANAHYGTYRVDEDNSTISFHVDVSTFPNWDGQVHERVFTLDGDLLSHVNPASTMQASSVEVVWRKNCTTD